MKRKYDITNEKKKRIGEKACIFCGSRDLLDVGREFYLSDKHFKKLASYVGVKAKPVIPLGSEKDIIDGHLLWIDFLRKREVAWHIIEAPVCLKCMWHILGRQRKSLKVDGERIFY